MDEYKVDIILFLTGPWYSQVYVPIVHVNWFPSPVLHSPLSSLFFIKIVFKDSLLSIVNSVF